MSTKVIENHPHHCLECGDRIEYGRIDRKFCCEKCKNSYNNRKTRTSRNFRLKVHHSLEKNYEILNQLVRSEVNAIPLSELTMLGFNIDFMTSYHKNRGHHECWCYDIRYFLTENRIFSIEKVVPLRKIL